MELVLKPPCGRELHPVATTRLKTANGSRSVLRSTQISAEQSFDVIRPTSRDSPVVEWTREFQRQYPRRCNDVRLDSRHNSVLRASDLNCRSRCARQTGSHVAAS